ncbi:hypothetical protein R3P38DRAFT_3492717 [Favolaschia claudopus]|uniref:Uncharacterized protein n=1 Tax=Favolaschia claudopus TaxID=2862362 RepID=A0AAW0EF78_9AGAR
MSGPLADTITGKEWISRPLPILQIDPKLLEKLQSTSKELDNSSKVKPPETYLAFDKGQLKRLFEHKVVKDALDKNYTVVDVEKSHFLHSEGDVERAENLYLIRGINFIWNAILEGLPPEHGLKTDCLSQVVKNGSRIDVYWISKDGRPESREVFLILEVKKCNILDPEQWTSRMYEILYTPATTGDGKSSRQGRIQKELDDLLPKLKGRQEDNQTHIVKQVRRYTNDFNAPIVLVFDWRHLIMLDLLPEMKAVDQTTNPAEIFISEEGTTAVRQPCEWTHRKVFIAALIRALEKLGYLEPVVSGAILDNICLPEFVLLAPP